MPLSHQGNPNLFRFVKLKHLLISSIMGSILPYTVVGRVWTRCTVPPGLLNGPPALMGESMDLDPDRSGLESQLSDSKEYPLRNVAFGKPKGNQGHWATPDCFTLTSVHFNHSIASDSLQPHVLQHARLPCPSPTPRAYSNLCPLSW